ncbi:hypothetical protein QP568_03775 [Propionimicrobium lymphophilum]|uniref:hypothetical protein n=1 Tax=Propionimicrobium TaxID=203133 RepID=UPI0003D7977D|nr:MULTISPECIES: hypothetical protein [Propionimicrobium]ETJ97169.1 hypothetical protein HMPREF1255_0932 [Propionimicrobium sp. BV2F7]MDK7709430.1 hypothetical protein [Propionimicrobium lymphophilum]MDK7733416.1 hypothetical protein [Propionimicrobium lymphophilum]
MLNFFKYAQENWDNPAGQLHTYLLPGTNFAELAQPYLGILQESSVCAAQPNDSFHATIQRLPFFADDKEICDRIPAFGKELRKHFAKWPIPEINFSYPEVTKDSVLCFATKDSGWTEFVDGVRKCSVNIFGEEASHFEGVPRAHLTLGYGVKDGSSEDLAKAIEAQNVEEKRHRSGAASFYTASLDHVALVTVHQRPEEGAYVFSSIAEFYLK